MDKTRLERIKKRTFEIIEIGTPDDYVSRVYDFTGLLAIFVNLTVSLMYTFDHLEALWGPALLGIERVTVVFFAVDYILRVWTAQYLRPDQSRPKAIWKYITSFTGLVDMLSFLPYYLPVFFPSGVVAFRMLRVLRIFRLFRINAYYDSLNVITAVLAGKRQQLISSIYIIVVLMLASSLCMYSLEHEAQPEVFSNAFSGVWLSVSTLLTVGYGDIYPITTAGKIMGIFLTCLGVGMVAIPPGIISAGFVEQASRLKRMSEMGNEHDIHFIKIRMQPHDEWVGMTISDIHPPHGMIVAAIQRGREIIVPRGNVMLMNNDVIVLGAAPRNDSQHIELKEIILRKQHEWNGQYIRDLDISRQTLIVMIKREGKMLVPKGDQMLLEGDTLVLYTQKHLPDARTFNI